MRAARMRDHSPRQDAISSAQEKGQHRCREQQRSRLRNEGEPECPLVTPEADDESPVVADAIGDAAADR